MNIEFHYHLTYIIALLAGYRPDQAYTVAYSSQYVDDNVSLITVEQKDGSSYFSCPTQVYCPWYSAGFTHTVYPVYHFLPGDVKQSSRMRRDRKRHPMLVTPNSKLAQKLMKWALSSDDLYTIGIASHAFVDTWAHQNFAGTQDSINSMNDNWLSVLTPNIGHADALEKPDLISNHWVDSRLKVSMISNPHRFSKAAKALLKCYATNLGIHSGKMIGKRAKFIEKWVLEVASFSKRFAPSLQSSYDLQLQYRMNMYQHLALKISNALVPEYNSQQWAEQAIRKKYRYYPLSQIIWRHANYAKSNWYAFQQAAKSTKRFVLHHIEVKQQVN
ncbi:MAG: hypothetical protein JSS50_03640 [Proteobacteria bacterium]|nr:hypothetical protein [Pseudomonadota bacterium]